MGQSGLITITGQLTTTISQEFTLWNSVVITSTNLDITATNNNDAVAVAVNLAPMLVVDSPYSVLEGDSLALTGSLSDAADMMDLVVVWGDGVTETAVYPSGSFAFTLTHTYLDDNPTTTSADMYTVTLHLTDSDGASTSGAASVTVANVSPDVQANAGTTHTNSGKPVHFYGSFTDPGVTDTFVITWDFGDGLTMTGTLSPTHSYLQPGIYTTTLTILDDDGGLGTDSLTVQVDPNQLFLPYIANNVCHSTHTLVDVMLVIDTSSSMNSPTQTGGQTKLTAAQAAATDFLNILPLPANQAGIISFGDTAVLAAMLTDNRQALLSPLAALTAAGTTRIDLALALARDELSGPQHRVTHSPALILLTDGVPNGSAASDVLAEAEATKAAGMTIYTIGLGTEVDSDLLQQVASSPNQFYLAPATADLDNIYQQIANAFNCNN